MRMTHASMIIMAIVYLLLISSCLLQWSSGTAFNPVVYDTKAPLSSQCGQSDPFEDDQQLMEALKMAQQQLPPPGCNPPPTCIDILLCNSSASSGYYQIQAANGSLVQAYCDMEGTNCGGQAGWMRVAHLNITDPSSQCPAGFRVVTRNNKMFCIRDAAGCQPITVESFGLTYSRVCGYVRGYAYRTPDGFWRQHLPAGSECHSVVTMLMVSPSLMVPHLSVIFGPMLLEGMRWTIVHIMLITVCNTLEQQAIFLSLYEQLTT